MCDNGDDIGIFFNWREYSPDNWEILEKGGEQKFKNH